MAGAERRKSGFTLIELLVVIAIIAVLISLLVPSLSRAKDLARKVSCANNLKQQGMALWFYMDDHGGYLPMRNVPNGAYPWMWYGKLNKYIEQEKTFFCPAAIAATYGTRGLSYGWNTYLNYRANPYSLYTHPRIEWFDQPDVKLCVADTTPHNPMGYGYGYYFYNRDLITYRHLDKANILFADLHVEDLLYEEVQPQDGSAEVYYWWSQETQ